MTYATATFPGVTAFDGRYFGYGREPRTVSLGHYRRVFTGAAIGFGTLAAAGAIAGTVTLTAMWMVGTALSTNPHIHAQAQVGPAALALASGYPSDVAAPVAPPIAAAAPPAKLASAPAKGAPQPTKLAAAPVKVPLPPKRVVAQANRVPLPPPRPPDAPQMQAEPKIARAPTTRPAPPVPSVPAVPPAPKVALAVPSASPQRPPPHDKSIGLPGPDGHTAIYDIAAHTVYLPNGDRLEAHSGLGKRLDDPRYVGEKGRGPTPPNVYELALRRELFHGVRAIRLNPVDDGKMFGRDGMLAHTYMLGPSGQSFGCVSFKDYPEFLHAFLRGEIDRLVVVPHLDNKAVPVRARRRPADRYAFNDR
jgi:Tlde1 domain